jgi:hypothetical protein
MLMSGLSCFGAAIALGLISAGTWPPEGAPVGREVLTGRGLSSILLAFCLAPGVLGVVVGLLTIFVAGDLTDPAVGLFAAVPAVIGGIVGLALVAHRARAGDQSISTLAALNILGIAFLGVVVAMMALLIVEEPTKDLTDWPFVVLGLINGASALAIGVTGGAAVQSMRGADEPNRRAIAGAQISRTSTFMTASCVACVIAIALILLG